MGSASTIKVNDKRTINAWAMFDWANSSYALVITTAIFPIYFNATVGDTVDILGFTFENTALFSFSIAAAYLIISLMLPVLSGIADYGGKRLSFMKFFTIMGSLACISLFAFKDDSVRSLYIGLIGFMLAIIGFAGSQVFYNSFLPIIVTEDRYDRVSAKGFTFGYIGSVILLIMNLVMIERPHWFMLDDWAANLGYEDLVVGGKTLATRIAFVMVGLWWLGFAQIPFRRLPKDEKTPLEPSIVSKGMAELRKVWQQVQQLTNTKRFLYSFFFYTAGAQTVIMLASTFATDVLNFETGELIVVILILQLVGAIGAFLFAKISEWRGNKISIMIQLFIWTIVCVVAYFVTEKWQFYIIAAAVGLVMGGIQSMSRSTYSKLIPEDTDDTTSFFSFYDVLEKVSIVLGTFSFGFINQITGGMRNSILALIVFFVLGIVILSRVTIQEEFSN